MRGTVFNIQRYSIHDGPGIRTLVFMKGCPLKCPWCDNPESQKPYPELAFDEKECTACGECIRACPVRAISENERVEINREVCNDCGICCSCCPTGALKFVGKEMGVSEIIGEVNKDTPFYLNSDGGVTVSGGEPTTYAEFVGTVLKECHRMVIHTAMETCGHAKWESFKKALRHADLVLYDLKVMDPIKHRTFTGVSNRLIYGKTLARYQSLQKN